MAAQRAMLAPVKAGVGLVVTTATAWAATVDVVARGTVTVVATLAGTAAR